METKLFYNPASDRLIQANVAKEMEEIMKRFQTIGMLFILTVLLLGCSENPTGPDYSISDQNTGRVVLNGEPSRTIIYAFGLPSVLLVTGKVKNIGETPAHYVRVRYSQGDASSSCGTSPLTVESGESASFAMHIDIASTPQGSGAFDITWCDNP